MVFVLSEEFVKVADTKDIPRSQLKEVEVGGENICIVNVEGKYFAIGSVCTHEGGPLADGTLEGYEVECPWHGSKFDVRTGEVKNPPADTPEPVYEVKVEGNNILVKKRITTIEQQQQDQKQPAASSIYQLTLVEKQKFEGTDIMSFKFTKQNEQKEVDQGNDKSSLDYKAGQYAFFDIGGVSNDPKGPIRHFTITSSPTENFIMISTRIRDTPYKKRLSSLEEGVTVKIRGPEGKFVLHEDYSKPAVFLSGGIGVTPFRTMIKYATDKQLPVKITMFDSNRNQANILYKDEFDSWAKLNKNLKIVYTITEEEAESLPYSASSEWKAEKGWIDKAMLTRHLSKDQLNDSIFYICGPPAMLNAMQKLLSEQIGVSGDKIRIEEFTGY